MIREFKMAFVNYNNTDIEFESFGSGKGLVLIHGTGQSAQNTWQEAAKILSKNHKVVCPNYAGSGKTPTDNQPLTAEFMANQVLAVADAAGLDRFDLGGHSLGAGVAMYLAAQYPGRVDKLFAVGGFSHTQETRMQLQFKLWHHLALHAPRQLARMFLFTAFSQDFLAQLNPESADSFVEQIYETTNWAGAAKQIELDLNFNIEEQVKKITRPTLVISCEHDYIIPNCHAHNLMELLPNATLVSLKAGHAGPVENLDQFVDLVTRFLKN